MAVTATSSSSGKLWSLRIILLASIAMSFLPMTSPSSAQQPIQSPDLDVKILKLTLGDKEYEDVNKFRGEWDKKGGIPQGQTIKFRLSFNLLSPLAEGESLKISSSIEPLSVDLKGACWQTIVDLKSKDEPCNKSLNLGPLRLGEVIFWGKVPQNPDKITAMSGLVPLYVDGAKPGRQELYIFSIVRSNGKEDKFNGPDKYQLFTINTMHPSAIAILEAAKEKGAYNGDGTGGTWVPTSSNASVKKKMAVLGKQIEENLARGDIVKVDFLWQRWQDLEQINDDQPWVYLLIVLLIIAVVVIVIMAFKLAKRGKRLRKLSLGR